MGVFSLEHVHVISFVGHTKSSDPKVGTLKMLIYTKGKVVLARTHPAIPLPLYAMVRGQSLQQTVIRSTCSTRPAPRMVANNSYRHANHSHESSDNKSENGSRDSESGVDHSHEPPSESGTVSRDSEAGMDNSENPVAEWEFHKGLELVIHDLNHCPRCSEFVMHYSSAKACLHPSHNMAYSACKEIIGRDLQDQIDSH